jgi:FtsH-binding integral membrane protein
MILINHIALHIARRNAWFANANVTQYTLQAQSCSNKFDVEYECSPDMKMLKAIAGITAVSGIGVALVTGIVVAGYWKNPAQRDLLITLPPIIIPATLSVLAAMTMVSRSDSRKRIGAMMGTCIGSLLYLLFPVLQFALQYNMIAHDGTGFWAVIMLPSVYLGIPLPILGALLGLAIGLIVDRVKRNSRGEPSPRPYGSPAAGSPSGQA